jgi:uncharacterized protein
MKKKPARKAKPSLMASVEAGDVAAVRAAVTEGSGLLDEMEDTSPLAIAVEKGNAKMVKALLDLGHKPDFGGIVAPLASAAQAGNKQIVDLLLKHGAKPNSRGEEGETAVMCAAGGGHLSIVKRLIEAGANIKQKDRGSEDALDYAVRGGSDEVIGFLLPQFSKTRQEKLARQAHLRSGTKSQESALQVRLQEAIHRREPKGKKRGPESLIRAFENGKHDKFLKLLAEGADPNETNKEGTTILAMVASSYSGVDLLVPLINAGADPNCGELFRPLRSAAFRGAESVRQLLNIGADVNWTDPDGGTALMAAAAAGDDEAVDLLLKAGANPNAEDHQGHTAYWYSLNCNNWSVAEILARLTADIDNARMPWRKNKEGKSPELCLIDAAKGKDAEHVKRLLADGVRVDVADEGGDTPLHCAAENGDLEMIDVLLRAGAPIDAEDRGDQTPLLTAARSGQTKAVEHLLGAGANVHANKSTILCYACENKDCLDLVELLIKAGAKVNVTGGFRRATPLHVATEYDQAVVVRALLNAGASVQSKDPSGWTPFLNAALRSGVETLQLLIDAGSDIRAVDREGRNAYELASDWGKPETAKFLKSLLQIK